ncbi:MAG: hypothetical protein NVV74_07645 [Magnetospirillum sp.]|nr:hypothetical protein [Magnetospirillum sp.]
MDRSRNITLGLNWIPATLQDIIAAAIAGTLAAEKNRQPQTISNLAIQEQIA